MATRTLKLEASIGRALLTRTHPNLYGPFTSINTLKGTNTRPIARRNIEIKKGISTGARLSSLPPSTSTQKDVATNTTSDGPSSRPGLHPHGASSPTEDDFKVSFHNLGMNRITKFVVYAVVGILGTMETIFWCKVIWRWWTGDEDDGTE